MSFFKRCGVIALVLAIGIFALTGCTTTSARISGSGSGYFPTVSISAKDWEPVGLVFAETTVHHSRNRDLVSASGEVLTYYALLQQAQRLGADAIINVTIDVKSSESSDRQRFLVFRLRDLQNRTDVWQGTALAIRYGESLEEGDIISGFNRLSQINSDGANMATRRRGPLGWFSR